ncbi:MAG: tetratricopeptide repeat protein [Verrucomicrobia bacterium]|nr:tetratricopeptide repeat protein [Verrucomicrobiota bacterium]
MLERDLTLEPSPRRERAAHHLASLGAESRLFQALRHPSKEVREASRRALDSHWFSEKGAIASSQLLRAERAANAECFDEALSILNELVNRHSDFADAYNRRAAVLWKMDRVGASMQDCQKTLRLNVLHYGAWLGLGLCHLELGNYDEAVRCLKMYLSLHPYDVQAIHWLHQCTEISRLAASVKERLPSP